MDFSDYWSDVVWSIEMPSFEFFIYIYFFKFIYFSCVPGFSNFVFRVLVFRRSGVPAFRHSGVPCFSTSPHGRWGLAQCKSTCEEHAGSDKSFENITLCLDQLPLKIQFTKEKRTLKTLVLSRGEHATSFKSNCKEQAGSDKNLSVNPYCLRLLL